MSRQLISRSDDLKKLQGEGYDISIQSNFLTIGHVPYLNSSIEVKYGTLVSALDLAGDVTTTPSTHVVYFAGEYPCNKDGSEIAKIKHQSAHKALGQDLIVDYSFSSKPPEGYKNYYEKMATYVAILSSPAQSVDPTVTACIFPVIEPDAEESVFNYLDTASTRADINSITNKLGLSKVGIVGLGGTGSYVLDLIAKTPIKEIHLYDRDTFLQHNAFRSPGAPSVEKLREQQYKVDYFKAIYANMHRNIITHVVYLDDSNVDLFDGMDFVFLCLDSGQPKQVIVEKLEALNIPFIDVGMGIQIVDEALHGILRITTSTPSQRNHVHDKNRISFSNGPVDNAYSRNIQIADLNALNAALAVVKWKKLSGFYKDFEHEHFSAYTIDGNALINEDQI